MPFSVPNGQMDSLFISRVRRNLRDQAVWFQESFPTDGVKGSVTVAGSTPYRLKRAPVVAAGAVVTLAGAGQTVVYDQAPTGAQVSITTDTGEVYWVNVPASGQTINISYQSFRYSDLQIKEALLDGLVEMWPDIWMPQSDNSIIYSPSQTEYTLPPVFNDPRVKILSVEVQPPAGLTVSIGTGMWRRQGLTTLIMTKPWPAGSVFRITYNGQYVNLGDLEGQIMKLPEYFATYKILLEQESMKTRQNDLVALTGEGGSAPKAASDAAALWLSQFERTRARLVIDLPVSSMVPGRAVETVVGGTGFSWNP